MNIIKILNHFGLENDPFCKLPDAREIYRTREFIDQQAALEMWLRNGEICALIGDVGSGKSTIIQALMQKARLRPDLIIVNITLPDMKWLTVSPTIYPSIAEALQEKNLTCGKLPKSRSGRANWLRTVLEIDHKGKKLVIIIDEAHRLNCEFLKDIKLLSEIKYADRHLSVGVLLVGQRGLAGRLRRQAPDVYKRVLVGRKIIEMSRMGADDVFGYIRHRLRRAGGDMCFDKLACGYIARMSTCYLDVNRFALEGMDAAYLAGKKTVTAKMLTNILSVKEKYEMAPVSYSELGRMAGVAAGTVCDFMNDKYRGDSEKVENKLHTALDTILLQPAGEEKTA